MRKPTFLERIRNSTVVWALGTLIIILGFLYSTIDFLESREPIDISGEWRIIFHIETSSLTRYENTDTNYKVYLTQKSKGISGQGKTWSFESDQNYAAQQTLTFDGKIEGYGLTSRYVLYGGRTTEGLIKATVDGDGTSFKGTFSGNGADVRGTVRGLKL